VYIGDDYAHCWLDKKGNVTQIVDMDDKHLMASVFYIDKMVREAWEFVSITESIANNAPKFLQFKPDWCLLYPSYYWNAIAELTKRGLYR